MTARVHTFNRSGWTLWADRIPAMHGRQSLFTLWKPRIDGGQDQVVVGPMWKLRAYLKGLSA